MPKGKGRKGESVPRKRNITKKQITKLVQRPFLGDKSNLNNNFQRVFSCSGVVNNQPPLQFSGRNQVPDTNHPRPNIPNQPSFTPQPRLGLYVQPLPLPSPAPVPLVPANAQQFYVNSQQLNIPVSLLLALGSFSFTFNSIAQLKQRHVWLWEYFKAQFFYISSSWGSRRRENSLVRGKYSASREMFIFTVISSAYSTETTFFFSKAGAAGGVTLL